MYSRQIEQVASRRPSELRQAAQQNRARSATHAAARGPRRFPRKPLRQQTGWALISLGLRIAESASR